MPLHIWGGYRRVTPDEPADRPRKQYIGPAAPDVAEKGSSELRFSQGEGWSFYQPRVLLTVVLVPRDEGHIASESAGRQGVLP